VNEEVMAHCGERRGGGGGWAVASKINKQTILDLNDKSWSPNKKVHRNISVCCETKYEPVYTG
jgi:hypothetical protein